MSIRVRIARSEIEKRLSYQLRFEVMCKELSWLPQDNYLSNEERDEYDLDQSVIFVAFDNMNNIVGTSRLILLGEIPLPVERHFELYSKEMIEALCGKMECFAEVSRFIVPRHPVFKRHEITLMLCREIIKMSIAEAFTHLLLSADYRFYRLLKILGFPLSEIGIPKFFMGSKTIPAILEMTNISSELFDEFTENNEEEPEEAVLT